jgi:hypothetical protein
MGDERREFQRLKLSKPILATIDRSNALMLDVGLAGAFLEHHGKAAPGQRFTLTFRWQGADVQFVCAVVRSTVVREAAGDENAVVSHTGVRFVEPLGEANARLQELITTFVSHILTAQKSNASGERAEVSPGATILARLGEARRMRSRGFVTYHLEDGLWSRTPTASPRQPPDGFTVGEHEEEDEVEALCATYEAADEEGRQLIRMLAELSARKES